MLQKMQGKGAGRRRMAWKWTRSRLVLQRCQPLQLLLVLLQTVCAAPTVVLHLSMGGSRCLLLQLRWW